MPIPINRGPGCDPRASRSGHRGRTPTVTHFDHDVRAMHTRDGKEMERGDSYMYVIKPLLEKYGREKVLPHINTMHGTFRQQMLPIVTELAELTYNHAGWSPAYIREVLPLQKEHGVRGELVIHQNSEIESSHRVYIQPGWMPNPNLWIMLPGAAARQTATANSMFEYYPNERVMAQRFILAIQDIREIDPGPSLWFAVREGHQRIWLPSRSLWGSISEWEWKTPCGNTLIVMK